MAGLSGGSPLPTSASPSAPAPAAPPSGDVPGQPPADDRVSDDEDTREAATPEEQAQYDAFVKGGMKLIADQGERILDLLDEDPADLKAVLGDAVPTEVSPPLALAATTVIVVLETLRRAGEKPEDEIIMHGGKELLEQIAQLAEDAKEQDYSQDQLNQAWLMGLDLYRETAGAEGLIDNDALKAQFDDLVTADKQGRLGEVLPALAKAKVNEAAPTEASPQGESANGGLR